VIIDSSALVAILTSESDADSLEDALITSLARRISAVTYVEASIVMDSRNKPTLSHALDNFLQVSQIAIEPVTVEQARFARQAYRDYGKGRHRAGLNFGDCFAYALAKDKGEPLLFKGDDFRRTDVEVAEY
jgi:ribonuclease VapC